MKNEATEHFWHFLEEVAQIWGLFVQKSFWWPPIFFDKLLIYLKIDISAKFHEDPMKNEVVRASQSWKKSSEGVNVDERPLCHSISMLPLLNSDSYWQNLDPIQTKKILQFRRESDHFKTFFLLKFRPVKKTHTLNAFAFR